MGRVDKFIELNEQSRIYKGAWVDKSGKWSENADRLRYWFWNKRTFTLSPEERAELQNRGYEPKWATEEQEIERINNKHP